MVRLLMVWLGVLRQGREGGAHSSVTGCTWIGSDGCQPSGKIIRRRWDAPGPDCNAPVSGALVEVGAWYFTN